MTVANIRLPDPLTNPNAPGFTSVRVIDNDPLFRDRLSGGKVLTLKSMPQYWGVVLSYEDLMPEEYDILYSSILRAKQTGAKFEVLLPHQTNFHVQGDTSNAVISAGQKGANLVIGGFTATVPKLGDIFRLTNHPSKVYKITSVNLVGATLTLGVYPNLFKTTIGTEKPIFNTVLYELVLENPSQFDSNFTAEGIYNGFQLELAESITDGT